MPAPTRQRIAATTVALLVGLGLAACGGDDGDGVGSSGDPTTTTTEAASAPTTAPDTTTTEGDGGLDGEAAATAEDAARAWIEAVGTGDLDAAWALTHPASQEAFGGRDAFDDAASGLAEGYGAWSGSTDATYTAVSLEEDQPGLAVVVIEGTVAKEGPPAPGADALPVRTDGDDALVDPFDNLLDEATIEFDPEPGSEISPQHTFAAIIPATRDARFIIDAGDPVQPTSEGVDGDQVRLSVPAEADLAPGAHSFAVVVIEGGRAQAGAVAYVVEG